MDELDYTMNKGRNVNGPGTELILGLMDSCTHSVGLT